MTVLEESLTRKKTESWQMFNRIAGRYDFINRVLSGGIDRHWRKRTCLAVMGKPEKLLDVATGTGDLLIEMLRRVPSLRAVTGIDPSENMLAKARYKTQDFITPAFIQFLQGAAQSLPFPDRSFDLATIAFGIRNVARRDEAFSEIHRVLKPGGQFLVLEFSLPTPSWFRSCYLYYLRRVLPKLGTFLSRDAEAYHYLNATIETFPYGEDFCHLLERAGFRHTQHQPMSWGICALYSALKE